jgi:Protein of unknown function (DUF1573)
MASRSWILGPIGIALLAQSAGAARATPPAVAPLPPVPRLIAARTEFDAGGVRPGQVVRADFSIRNAGRAPLHIADVKKECGCTDVEWDRVIAPGKTGHLRIALHTEKFRGAVEKHVRLLSDDPQADVVVFIIRAVVPLAVEVLPSENLAISFAAGESQTAEVTLRSTDEIPLRVSAIQSAVPYLLAEVAPESAANGPEVKLRVSVTAAAPPESFESQILVRTGHPGLPILAIRVFGQAAAAVAVRPPRLWFPVIRPDATAPVERLLTLASPKRAVRVIKVEDPEARLQARVVPGEDPSYMEIRVTYPGGWVFPPVQGMLRITTDDPTRPVIEVPYVVGVRDSSVP